MSNTIYYSRGPIISDKEEDLVQRVYVGGVKEVFIPFVKHITWVRETEASISYWHGNKLLYSGSEFNDYYGFFESFNSALEAAHSVMNSHSISQESSLELKITMNIYDMPLLKNKSEAKYYSNSPVNVYNKLSQEEMWFENREQELSKYLNIIQNHYGQLTEERIKAFDEIECFQIKRKDLEKNICVWSSKVNTSILEDLKRKYIPVVTENNLRTE